MPKECDFERGVSRREFLRYTLIGTGIAALGPFGKGALSVADAASMMQPPSPQNILTVINQYGGNDGINTIVPVQVGSYFSRRGTLAIQPSQALTMNTGPYATTQYMMHPMLPRLQQLWTEGSVAVINLVGYPQANLSHFLSQDIWSYGVRGDFSNLPIYRSGWVARYADLYTATPTGAIAIQGGRPLDFTGGQTVNPMNVRHLSTFDFLPDNRYPDNHDHRINTIKNVLAGTSRTGLQAEVGDAIQQAHDMTILVQQAVANYTGTIPYNTGDYLHRQMRDIATLIEGGFDTQIFYTGIGGFDHHSNQLGSHQTLLGRLDDAVGYFSDDLKRMGVWQNHAIAIISEFGRRNYANGSNGTDHGHGNSLILVGGGVNGGIYGRDINDADMQLSYPSYEIDFRSVYKETIQNHLGVDPAPVFPESQDKNTLPGVW